MTKELKHTQVAASPPICPGCKKPMGKAGVALSGRHKVQNWRCNNKDCSEHGRRRIKGAYPGAESWQAKPVKQARKPTVPRKLTKQDNTTHLIITGLSKPSEVEVKRY